MTSSEERGSTAIRAASRRAAGTDASAAQAARTAVTVVFAVHGLLFASWTAHIPEVKADLRLGDGGLGLALMGAPVGSVCAMLLASSLLARFGSRAVVRVTLIGYCLSGPLVGIAGSLAQLFAVLAVWGAFQGVLDIAMNAQGVAAERARDKPIMSTLHGWWSVGALTGAGTGAAGVALGLPLTAQLLIVGVPGMAAGLWLSSRFVPDPPAPHREEKTRGRVPRVLLVLGAIAFAGLVCEGAAADWTAVYLHETLRLDAGVAGLGYAAFAAAMVVVRMSGTRLQERFGPRPLVATLALAASFCMGGGLLLAQPVVAMLGFAALGAGLASVIPVIFSAAGNQPGTSPGTGIAIVCGIAWAGFMCGPVIIGFIADQTSQAVALGLLPLLTLFIAAGAWRTTALDRAGHS